MGKSPKDSMTIHQEAEAIAFARAAEICRRLDEECGIRLLNPLAMRIVYQEVGGAIADIFTGQAAERAKIKAAAEESLGMTKTTKDGAK